MCSTCAPGKAVPLFTSGASSNQKSWASGLLSWLAGAYSSVVLMSSLCTISWAGAGRRRCGLGPHSEQGGRTSVIIVNRFPVELQSSSLVLANEKLLAGFQRKAPHTPDASASVLLSASQGLYSLRSEESAQGATSYMHSAPAKSTVSKVIF